MLGLQHAGGQPLRCIALKHGYPRGSQNRSAIVDLVYQMNGDARLSRPASQHRLVDPPTVHTLAAEGREQGRMGIDDAAAVCSDDSGWHQLQVAGQNDEIDCILPKSLQPRAAIRRPGEDPYRNVPDARMSEPRCFGFVAQYEYDFGGRTGTEGMK